MNFLSNFIKEQKIELFGLDIGSTAVKLVQLESDKGQFRAKKLAYTPVSNAGDDLPAITEAVKNCISQANIDTKYAVCAVRGPEIAVRSFIFPNMPAEEITQAVLLEAEQVCPFDVSQSVVDYQLTDSPDGRTHGVLVAATADVIANHSKIARKSHLHPIMVDSESLALLNCFQHQRPADNQTVALLDIGSRYTTMVIVQDTQPPFVRDLEHSGNEIIQSVSSSCSLSADEVKDKLFDQNSAEDADFVYQVVNSCQNLISGIEETFRYYERIGSKNVDKVYLCGGFAKAVGVMDILSDRLACDVELWNPFDKIGFDSTADNLEITEKFGSSFGVATGLAMRIV